MALWSQFVGSSYQARSPVIAADQAINVYIETREVPGSPKQATYYGTPGLKWFTSVTASSGCRGTFTQDGQTWMVIATTLYEVHMDSATMTSLGTIANDGFPVSFASNGQGGDQLGVLGGGELKVLDLTTNVLSAAVVLPFSHPVMLAFIDGYALVNQADSPIVWYSALEDMTTWDALDFFARSGTSDNLVGIAVSRDRVWVFGSKTTTQYYDSGDTDNPFLPYPGTTIQTGLASPWLLGLYNDVLYWVGQSAKGQRRVLRALDAQAQDISTPPIDRFLADCPTLADAEMLLYEQEGHVFVIVTAPSSPEDVQTYAFDIDEKAWHARAGWDSTRGRSTRWRARGCTSANGTILVGDYANGNLYTLDLNTYDDNGAILRRERTAPYLSAENQWFFVDQFELGMQPGVGLANGQGSAPVVTLEISRDGARTWTNAGLATLGAMGQYTARAIWRRLGRFRADLAVFRVSMTDPVKCVWGPGAWLRISNGSGQL